MSKILGIIGGGQLGMMITEAAKKMPENISKVIVLDPTENCPAYQVGAEQIIADFKDSDPNYNIVGIINCDIDASKSKKMEGVLFCRVAPGPGIYYLLSIP